MAGKVHFSGWRSSMDSKTLADGQQPKSGRVYTMYHGTHINNARAIITGGFKPSTGGLLGKGVYVSRNIDKAKCYPLKTDNRDKVVFKMKVNVGKVKMIDCDNHPLQKAWHENGYDCAWIPPMSNVSAIKSGREEDCVWDPSRITVVDVALCMDYNKRRELRSLIRQHVRAGACGLCGEETDEPHDVQDCWQCGNRICPFEKKHPRSSDKSLLREREEAGLGNPQGCGEGRERLCVILVSRLGVLDGERGSFSAAVRRRKDSNPSKLGLRAMGALQAQQQGSRRLEGHEGSRPMLWKLYSEVDAPHPALASSAAELCYSRAVVDLLLHVLVPYPHLETRTGHFLVGELITCNVLLPLVAQISNPDWLNQTIVDVCTKSAGPENDSMMDEPPSPWDQDFHTPIPWDQSETSSMQTARSNSTLPLQESSECSLQTCWTYEDSTKGRATSESPSEGAAPSTPEPLRSPCKSRQLYCNTDYDTESPFSDSKKVSNESLDLNDSEVDKDETFCDCINPADFCGLVCLDDDTLALLGKRIRPKVLISEALSRPESPMEELSAGSLPQAVHSSLGGSFLSPFGLESLGCPEGPVVIKNLRITGTVTAKEQKGNTSHPYTLYTVKYETVMDADSLSTDQAVDYHTVNRRYSEFLNLQTRLEERSDLKKVIKNVKGPKKLFPDLSFGNPDAEKVEARKGQLESFLKKLCSIPEAARSEEVQEFLALNTDASAAFEKKPCGSRIDKMVENIVDTLKTAFPRSEPQSPTDDGEPDADGRTPDSRKKSRLRFSSIIAPTTLSVPDFQPKITYCFSEGSTVFKGPLGLEGFVLEQEKRLDGEPRRNYTREEEQEEKAGEKAAEKRTRGTDTALADVALNILCLLMKDQWSWLCTENIQKTIRLLFGTIIESSYVHQELRKPQAGQCQESITPGNYVPQNPLVDLRHQNITFTGVFVLSCLLCFLARCASKTCTNGLSSFELCSAGEESGKSDMELSCSTHALA
ncbi:hypothetical protein NFI96_002082 [Prochilodus magdalenae]|nr:hypothetical protein NFI96_002082 [Prochilodus magdalenae]